MKTTTVSIHVPLTKHVLEGLEENKAYLIIKNGVERLVSSYWFKAAPLKYLDKGYVILIERSFTEEEILGEAQRRYPVKYINSMSNTGIRREDLNEDKRSAFLSFFNWALSLPNNKQEGK
jgi:hypothetical protein